MKKIQEFPNLRTDYVGHSVSSVAVPICGDFFSTLPADREYFLLPGFADVHVHLREPGFSYKETIRSGSAACARGGYSDVCAMPNLNPVPDCLEHLQLQRQIIARDARIRVHPYGAITRGQQGRELADLQAMAPYVAAFSDDGRGVQDRGRMLEAMQEIRRLGKLLAAHCEDNSLLRGGYIHDGAYARAHGHRGICSESEWGPIARDLELVAQTGCAYHVCHVSTKESVELIRQARRSGLPVSCETGPHYLALDDSCLQEDGRFKMNPPLRDRSDREALVEALAEGVIEIIATDHAPHSAQEKARGLEGSAMGVVGIETALPVLYSYLVKPGLLPMERVLDALTRAPRERFGLPQTADFSLWDLTYRGPVRPEEFLSQGRATPFAGLELYGRCLLTVCDGSIVWQEERR